jgi:indole-3-acetate monooxygenase
MEAHMATQATRTIDLDSEPLEAARRLAPAIREASAVIEDGRCLPPDLVEAMRAAGLFHMTIPRSMGGLQTDPLTHLRVVEEVAAADGSAGWCVMIASQAGAEIGFMDPEAAREVTRDGGIVCGVARPVGRAVPVMEPFEGYRISGRWPFASGSSHASWFSGEALVYDDGSDTPRKNEQGDDVVLTFIVPRDQVTVHDVWFTTGLRGTASNDFSLEDVDIPLARIIDLAGGPRDPWPALGAFPVIVMNHGAHALGVARAALEAAAEVIRTKRGWGGVPLRDTGRLQQVLAEATAMHEASKGYFYAAAEALWAEMQEGESTAEARARARLAASHAGNESVRVVDLLHRALATSAIMQSSPLDRQFRDIHTAAAHVMIGPLTYEAAGRVLLGDDAHFPLF